jgi:hypothetical protein
MTSAKGSFDFLRSECVVGTALRVERTYFGGQLASGEGVTLDFGTLAEFLSPKLKELTLGGKMMGGGGSSSSATLKGALSRSVG